MPRTALVAWLALGCAQQESTPVKVSEMGPVVQERREPARKGPFSNPERDAPGPREGAQLEPGSLAEAIEKARGLPPISALALLQRCANRVPQSVECEGELALILLGTERRKAHGTYYLEQAALAEPAVADTDLYRRLGEAALKAARWDAAAAALGIVAARDGATADDYGNYATAIQAAGQSPDLAIEAYRKGLALDPTRKDWEAAAQTLQDQLANEPPAVDPK